MLRRQLLQAFPLVFARGGGAAPLAQFDEVMRTVIERQQVPGGSLSIAKDGRLVYARGFGLAGSVPVSATPKAAMPVQSPDLPGGLIWISCI